MPAAQISAENTLPRRLRRITAFLTVTAAVYLVLLIPDPEPAPPKPAARKAFAWNQDQYWSALESSYVAARQFGCENLDSLIQQGIGQSVSLTNALHVAAYPAEDTLFDAIERNIFTLAPMVAACPQYLHDYAAAITAMRTAVKEQSRNWDMQAQAVRDRLYRLLYGSRAAMEEVMLQASPASLPPIVVCYDEPSATPSTEILGVRVHSGDILVSRGGAATSAFIARGNDYPGNFSHVALVHVDSSGHASIIEAHIEKGVAVASIEEYLRDTKLRVMVLRFRADLLADSMLPHKAAAFALRDAGTRRIPYDFKMNFHDSTEFFCSEVASSAYRHAGITLWMGLSSISTVGVSSWLAAFGVEHFETQEPADLEYDPQLRVVAEWRDPDVLFKDHIDNAVIDVMLEGAEKGERLDYDWYMLPVVRVVKAYSAILNGFGGVGPVPEGMSSTAALRNKRFTERHARMTAFVLERVQQFEKELGYVPPYWELVRFAREAKSKADS
ncbi:hypothetical protein FBQ87_03345 [Sphingobacteriales bacterium CHB3]|nr:hypothetical protein [Sphingobacteriales bacterium CHB3]